ncbi:MAG: hypothetical protein ABSC08_12975 [Bryobacteraceae bacterium]|jgi:hypothetical protein
MGTVQQRGRKELLKKTERIAKQAIDRIQGALNAQPRVAALRAARDR